MSASEPDQLRRSIVVDTETPGTEIFVLDAKGKIAARGIRKLEAELPVALYKIRYQIGDRVTDDLIELSPGDGAFRARIPDLPIVSVLPVASQSTQDDPLIRVAEALSRGPRVDRGSGASLFIFINPDQGPGLDGHTIAPPRPGAGLSIHRFSGELVVDLSDVEPSSGCIGCNLVLDPGLYLLRAKVDSGPAVEQTVVATQGWQTRVFIRLMKSWMVSPADGPQSTQLVATSAWQFDLPRMGVIMVRPEDYAEPRIEDLRWTAAARQALASGRGDAAPNREVMRALLRGKFANPMLGIYAGHLLALQEPKKRGSESLREVYQNLSSLIGGHPDLEALLIALDDPGMHELTYPEPPMLRASWSLISQASTAERDMRPEQSYSARISASLWGTGAWLGWRMPPPDTSTGQTFPFQFSTTDLLQTLVKEAIAGQFDQRLKALFERRSEVSALEKVLAASVTVAASQLTLANELTQATDNNSSFVGRILFPVVRQFVASNLQKETRGKIADSLTPEAISKVTGIPVLTVRDGVLTLARKLGFEPSGGSRK